MKPPPTSPVRSWSSRPRYAPAWLLLGRAREGLSRGDPDLCAAGRPGLCLRPRHRPGRHPRRAGARLVRLGGGDGLPALSPAYVRALFDGYAPRFERHLVEGLGYVGPELVRAALPQDPGRFAAAFDLGCGTGLMGAAIRDRIDHLTGIDLSPGMLALARAKAWQGRPLYDRLAEGDLSAFLAGQAGGSADLCLAADVLIYVADLGPVLAQIGRVQRPGGIAAFTVQSHGATGTALGPDGRYRPRGFTHRGGRRRGRPGDPCL